MFLKKNIMSLLMLVCCFCAFCMSQTSDTYCSLDRIKQLAMDACEHLGARKRRSIGFESTNTYTPNFSYLFNISRENYPFGGYLIVGQEHYNILSLLDVSPRYKANKYNHIMNEIEMRSKREENSDKLLYCCYHKCDEDFFCV